MRLALAWADADDAGIAAREVRGSIWSGELVEARLGALPLGTVKASLSPLALLGRDVDLGFARRDDRLGALSGRLHGSNPPIGRASWRDRVGKYVWSAVVGGSFKQKKIQ